MRVLPNNDKHWHQAPHLRLNSALSTFPLKIPQDVLDRSSLNIISAQNEGERFSFYQKKTRPHGDDSLSILSRFLVFPAWDGNLNVASIFGDFVCHVGSKLSTLTADVGNKFCPDLLCLPCVAHQGIRYHEQY